MKLMQHKMSRPHNEHWKATSDSAGLKMLQLQRTVSSTIIWILNAISLQTLTWLSIDMVESSCTYHNTSQASQNTISSHITGRAYRFCLLQAYVMPSTLQCCRLFPYTWRVEPCYIAPVLQAEEQNCMSRKRLLSGNRWKALHGHFAVATDIWISCYFTLKWALELQSHMLSCLIHLSS